ncbi:hypothetical protein TRVL_00433 [Trypanosoma vivax]|nr:hypothetical protein TRVL_00433 [Trypanosoma vivax]
MLGNIPLQKSFHSPGVPNPRAPLQTLMMMYDVYPKTSTVATGFANTAAVAAVPAAFTHRLYGTPVSALTGLPSAAFDEDAGGSFEVHDSHLKAPIVVQRSVVFPTLGSFGLFRSSQNGANNNAGGRSTARICDLFHEGRCASSESCSDIHVHPEYLVSKRQEMFSWLENSEKEFQNTLDADPNKNFRVFCADLKEIVSVPISALRFTKGLYVDPSVRARRTRGGHQNQYAILASQVPTACGLFLLVPSQCKWGRWCNQIHIDAGWMQSMKKEFELWSNKLEVYFNSLPPQYQFTVHDPQLKASLSLPKACISGFSRGLFQGSAKKAPSVCMLFQRNRCTANACCNQIHVVPEYLNLRRRLAQNTEMMAEERDELVRQMEAILNSIECNRGSGVNNDVITAAHKDFLSAPASVSAMTSRVDPGNGMDNCVESIRLGLPLSQGVGEGTQWQSDSAPAPSTCPVDAGVKNTFGSTHVWPCSATRTLPVHENHSMDIGASSVGDADGRLLSSTTVVNEGQLDLGADLVTVVEEEQLQSSLQASYTNMYASKGLRRLNNLCGQPGVATCTASPTFGWVQPVHSAGNSITNNPMNLSCGGNSEMLSKTSSASPVHSDSCALAMMSPLMGGQHGAPDMFSGFSPPSLHLSLTNASFRALDCTE